MAARIRPADRTPGPAAELQEVRDTPGGVSWRPNGPGVAGVVLAFPDEEDAGA